MDIETLYQNHKNEIIDFTYRIVSNREIAEDITQESFIVLLRETKFQYIENPRGYLYQVAKNLAFDVLKHKKVTLNYQNIQLTSPDTDGKTPSVEKLVADEQYLEKIKQVINELPPRCRETILLNRFYEMNYIEIAKFTGISESGVEKHMMKGLKHCRKKFPEFLPKKNQLRSQQAIVV